MQVLVAGASGALGAPLVRALIARGHTVIGLSRTPAHREELRALGAEPVIVDALDRPSLLAAVADLRADAVIHELTALKKLPMRQTDLAITNALRTAGTANMLAAARAVGARRFLAQSFVAGYGYGDHGTRLLTEDDPFASQGQGAFEATATAALRAAEQQTFTADGIEGVALRYGAFYGPGAGTMELVERLRRHRMALPLDGGGTLSWVYIEDAAAATVAAMERGRPGEAYNVVDDQPVSWWAFLSALATAFGTPRPLQLPSWVFAVTPYARAILTSTLRVSNEKARRQLGWAPAAPTYREGIQLLVHAERGTASPSREHRAP